jgi:hypothetical protein
MKWLGWTIVVVWAGVGLGQEPGQTPRPTTPDPVREPTDEELVKLDKTLPVWSSVKDDAPFVYAGKSQMDAVRQRKMIEEEEAFNYVLGVAHRQPADRLRRAAVKDVPLENLFHDIRADYLRELLHIEGQLALVLPMKATDELKALYGIEHLYEAWVHVPGTSRPRLVCVVVSELPAGVSPGENQNVKVAFDAYYFKLWHYETRKVKDPAKDPEKHEWHRAPLLLGKTFEVTGAVTAETTYTPGMLYGVIGGLAALALAALGMGLWFRRGDRHIRAAARQKIVSGVTFENVPDPAPAPVNRIADRL